MISRKKSSHKDQKLSATSLLYQTCIAAYPSHIIFVLLSRLKVDTILEPLASQYKGCFVVSPTIRPHMIQELQSDNSIGNCCYSLFSILTVIHAWCIMTIHNPAAAAGY
jgi:hypothetical protein